MNFVVATGNRHKLEEVQRILGRALPDARVDGAHMVGGMPPVEENGSTFEANARLKALSLYQAAQARGHDDPAWFIADDSGLVVPALDNAPGLYSSRYAGPGATDPANRKKLIYELQSRGLEHARAAFVCVIVVVREGREEEAFEGRCEGIVRTTESGDGGFGYDPLFVPHGYSRTFSELSPEMKNQISHRGEALARMARWLRDWRPI